MHPELSKPSRIKLKDGSYNYIARYVDDVMCYSKEPGKTIEYLEISYITKWNSTPMDENIINIHHDKNEQMPSLMMRNYDVATNPDQLYKSKPK